MNEPGLVEGVDYYVENGLEAAGLRKNVHFSRAETSLDPKIDDAYRAKYASSPYLGPMIGDKAKAATVLIVPANS